MCECLSPCKSMGGRRPKLSWWSCHLLLPQLPPSPTLLAHRFGAAALLWDCRCPPREEAARRTAPQHPDLLLISVPARLCPPHAARSQGLGDCGTCSGGGCGFPSPRLAGTLNRTVLLRRMWISSGAGSARGRDQNRSTVAGARG